MAKQERCTKSAPVRGRPKSASAERYSTLTQRYLKSAPDEQYLNSATYNRGFKGAQNEKCPKSTPTQRCTKSAPTQRCTNSAPSGSERRFLQSARIQRDSLVKEMCKRVKVNTYEQRIPTNLTLEDDKEEVIKRNMQNALNFCAAKLHLLHSL